jgi:hypothetical protein
VIGCKRKRLSKRLETMIKIEPSETELLILANQVMLINAMSLLVLNPLSNELIKGAERTEKYIKENYDPYKLIYKKF